jgi:hypothetical protein
MGIQNKSEFIVFICIIIFSMLARIEIVHELPLGTSKTEYGLQGFDDEPSHYMYLRYILENGQLPVEQHTIADSNAFEINEFEYHQPPLYYLLVSGFCRLTDVINVREQFYDGRYINLLLSLLSFYIFYLIFFEIGWKNEQIYAAISMILLLGSHVYQTALFGNDMLSWFIFWLIIYLILRGSIKNWLAISILLTLGHYTKTNILLIYPVLIWSLYSEYKKASEKVLLKSVTILIVPVVFALPWYIRNYQLYDSFLMLSGSEWQFTSGYFESIKKIIHAPYSFLFRMHFLPPKELISIFNIMQYLFVFPLIAAGIWQSLKNIKRDYNQHIFLILLSTILIAYLWLAIPTGFTEGRMLYPALPAIIYFIFIPLFHIENKFKLSWFVKYVIMICIFIPPYIIGYFF